ncbi:MAG: hypothetical protein HQK51_02390 [Oligoflexia bacterium]|nr:hypothetical protein [Oligoflexia bacterium]
MSHFWWSIAKSSGPNDWINEGGAEFSSFILSEKLFGQDYKIYRLKKYIDRIRNSTGNVPIANTETTSDFRYLNRYEKTTIMFYLAKKKFGAEKLFNFLKKYLEKYQSSHNANTENFLEMASKEIGKEAQEYFKKMLFSENFKNEIKDIEEEYKNEEKK